MPQVKLWWPGILCGVVACLSGVLEWLPLYLVRTERKWLIHHATICIFLCAFLNDWIRGWPDFHPVAFAAGLTWIVGIEILFFALWSLGDGLLLPYAIPYFHGLISTLTIPLVLCARVSSLFAEQDNDTSDSGDNRIEPEFWYLQYTACVLSVLTSVGYAVLLERYIMIQRKYNPPNAAMEASESTSLMANTTTVYSLRLKYPSLWLGLAAFLWIVSYFPVQHIIHESKSSVKQRIVPLDVFSSFALSIVVSETFIYITEEIWAVIKIYRSARSRLSGHRGNVETYNASVKHIPSLSAVAGTFIAFLGVLANASSWIMYERWSYWISVVPLSYFQFMLLLCLEQLGSGRKWKGSLIWNEWFHGENHNNRLAIASLSAHALATMLATVAYAAFSQA